MLGIKKRDTKQVFKAIAHQQGVSVLEVKERITAMTQMCKLNFQVILERNDLHQKNTFIRWQQKLNTDFMKNHHFFNLYIKCAGLFLSFFYRIEQFLPFSSAI